MNELNLTGWDVALIIVVTTQSLALAYAETPRWKRLFMTLPFPFTLVVLSVGRPIDGSNFASMIVLFAYTQICRILHTRLGIPIVPTIFIGVTTYAAIGWMMAGLFPSGNLAFWIACVVIVGLGIGLNHLLKSVPEVPYRTTLPLAVKLPALLAISVLLVLLKNGLQGFAGFFPLVSVIAAYETRTSPWTLARPVPVLMMTITPMLIVTRLLQPTYGLGTGLAAGWVAFGLALTVVWRQQGREIKNQSNNESQGTEGKAFTPFTQE